MRSNSLDRFHSATSRETVGARSESFSGNSDFIEWPVQTATIDVHTILTLPNQTSNAATRQHLTAFSLKVRRESHARNKLFERRARHYATCSVRSLVEISKTKTFEEGIAYKSFAQLRAGLELVSNQADSQTLLHMRQSFVMTDQGSKVHTLSPEASDGVRGARYLLVVLGAFSKISRCSCETK